MFSFVLPRNGLTTTRMPLERSLARGLLNWQEPTVAEYLPRADVLETRDKIIVRLELPGLSAEDVSVNLEKDILTIKAERRPPERSEGELYHRSEIAYGVFTRAFTLSGAVSRDGIEATYVSGVLTVTLPKAEDSQSRVIEVKSA